MRKILAIWVIVLLIPALGACTKKGSSANPPTAFTATAGDGRVMFIWNSVPNVEYWLFTSTDPASTLSNWTSSLFAHSFTQAVSPFYLCGLYTGTPYYAFANGRISNGPGGQTTATISATPYDASARWVVNSSPLTRNLVTPNLNGVGYTSLTVCSNSTISAAGSFAAVGAGGAIYTSSDGKNWSAPITMPIGLTSDLYAVTGYAVNQNMLTNPGLRWVAVGAGGASVYSTDGVNWNVGRGNFNNPALRSLTQVAGTFIAVGDTGTIVSSVDGITWTSRTAVTTNNLRGIARGAIYVAVGDNGTILTSGDSYTWGVVASGTTNTLRQVVMAGSIIVAVGDSGTIATSINSGATWSTQVLPGAPNLVGATAEAQLTLNAPVDPLLNFIPSALFVVADNNGNIYTSANGLTWSNAVKTGVASVNALISSGFGYVAVGNSGTTASAF